jgi:hypothetical protein
MGIPVGEIIYGTDCPICTPASWLPGETPKYLVVQFAGMVVCEGMEPYIPVPVPSDITFTLTQDSTYPCVWWGATDGWDIYYCAGTTESPHAFLYLSYAEWSYFANDNPANPACDFLFDNELTCGEYGKAAHLGTAIIAPFSDEIAPFLTDTMGFHP